MMVFLRFSFYGKHRENLSRAGVCVVMLRRVVVCESAPATGGKGGSTRVNVAHREKCDVGCGAMVEEALAGRSSASEKHGAGGGWVEDIRIALSVLKSWCPFLVVMNWHIISSNSMLWGWRGADKNHRNL